MSGPYPDDPIKNAPAHAQGTALAGTAAVFVPVSETTAHVGTFDSIVMVDGAGNRFTVQAEYDTGNNNVVAGAVYIQRADGTSAQHRFQLGLTTSITDPGYWKLDSLRAWPKDTSLMLRLAGHQIQDSSPFRRMGQGAATYEIAGVWAPLAGGLDFVFPPVPDTPTFIDVPKASPFYDEIEEAVAMGIVSGYTDINGNRVFKPGLPVNRAQDVAIEMRGLHSVLDKGKSK